LFGVKVAAEMRNARFPFWPTHHHHFLDSFYILRREEDVMWSKTGNNIWVDENEYEARDF